MKQVLELSRPATARRQSVMVLTPPQLRAARTLIGWSREDLAIKSGTAAETVQGFESRGSNPKLMTVQRWRRALQDAGVLFIEDDGTLGPGVRLRESESRKRTKR